jgi:hypothetical protein
MNREQALKILLVFLGVLFSALAYPLVALWQPNQADALQMMLSVYVTLGIFLLLAARNPSGNRTLIAFTAWSSFAHAAVMVVQALQTASEGTHLLIGVAALVIIGVALLALAPAKQFAERASTAST